MAPKDEISRRELFKLGAGAGAMAFLSGGVLAKVANAAEAAGQATTKSLPQVPRRMLGKTGKSIPILLVGGAVPLDPKFDPKLSEAMRFGVDYIDAADCYGGGTCETHVGNWLVKATTRDKVWITSKSDQHDPAGLEATLDKGLAAMRTSYFDLYFMHALEDPASITPELGKKVEALKKSGKIRHFGFSCHDGTVVELLNKAAATPWIEAIMFRYDFTQYGNKELNAAMDACVKANVGLIAMKTQKSAVSFQDKWEKLQVGKWTKHQAVMKAVWADERIAAAVSHMDNLEKLKQNIAAALNDESLGQADWEQLNHMAAATRSQTCDGCDHLCNPGVEAPVKIGSTLRFLMYHDVYGEQAKAKALFRKLPSDAQRISGIDYTGAATRCPHGVDIARHMARAAEVFEA
jgi:hypothetical protein